MATQIWINIGSGNGLLPSSARNHYQNQCRIIINEVRWNSPKTSSTESAHDINSWNGLGNMLLSLVKHLPRANVLKYLSMTICHGMKCAFRDCRGRGGGFYILVRPRGGSYVFQFTDLNFRFRRFNFRPKSHRRCTRRLLSVSHSIEFDSYFLKSKEGRNRATPFIFPYLVYTSG